MITNLVKTKMIYICTLQPLVNETQYDNKITGSYVQSLTILKKRDQPGALGDIFLIEETT